MRMDGREEGREMREVSWEKTPFGKEVSLLLLSNEGNESVMMNEMK